MRANWRLLFAGLVLSGSLGACLSDVEYLRAGNKTGNTGGDKGQGGNAGSYVFGGASGRFTSGGTDEGGKGGVGNNTADAGEAGDPSSMGGTSGSSTGGGGGGGTGGVTGCSPGVVELFDFENAMYVANTSNGLTKYKWVKGPYDSTDTSTGKADASASPPSNPKNLANMSILDVNTNDGDSAPSMRYTIPFNPLATTAEHVHILYIFAAYGEPAQAVDFSKATLKASVTLASAPNNNCVVQVNAWTTGTDALGQAYHHIDGPKATVTAGKWTSVQMNLSTSQPPNAVNQYGFAMHSSCSKIDMGTAGAGGAPDIPMGPTVILFDNIATKCGP